MKRCIVIVGLFTAALILSGCSLFTSSPAPTPIPISDSSSQPRTPTTTPEPSGECQLTRSFLDELAAILPEEQSVITHQTYGGEDELAVWLVSPNINQPSPEQNQAIAEGQAIQAGKTLLEAAPCLMEIETLKISVVDVGYQLWFSGSLRTVDLPDLQTEQSGGGSETQQGGGRINPAIPTLPPLQADACSWPEAASRLKESFAARQPDAAFTFVRDVGGNNVYAQWSVPDRQAALEIIQSVTEIAAQVACLHPPATGISILLTLPDGQILLTGYQPINEDHSIDPAAFTFNMIEQQ